MLKSLFASAADMEQEVYHVLKKIPKDFGGGCSFEKALAIANLIKDHNLQTTLDIGVYRGRSFFPQAVAHKCTGGVAYGVDPYTAKDAEQYDRPEIQDALDKFVKTTDFEGLYQDVVGRLKKERLEKHGRLIRKRSDEAVKYFKEQGITFDLIHIDGNHDEKAVSADVELYAPLVKKGGFIVMDDISWPSVQPGMQKVNEMGEKIIHYQVLPNNDFAVFRV